MSASNLSELVTFSTLQSSAIIILLYIMAVQLYLRDILEVYSVDHVCTCHILVGVSAV